MSCHPCGDWCVARHPQRTKAACPLASRLSPYAQNQMAATNAEGIHSARLGLPRFRRRGQHVRRPNQPTFFPKRPPMAVDVIQGG